MKTISRCLWVAVCLNLPLEAAVMLNQVEDFTGGHGWMTGDPNPNPPVIQPDSGPLGPGDHALRVSSNGSSDAGGRLIVFNRSLWIGDYTAAGILQVSADLLTNQRNMLLTLDDVLYAFQRSLETLGLAQDVVTFTCSDFGGTLRSSGPRGTFPLLVIDGAYDIGRGGRIFPQRSADEYFCELLRWFGVTAGDIDMVLPNITNFYNPASTTNPVGFLA